MALAPAATVARMLSEVLPPLAMMGTSGKPARIFFYDFRRLCTAGNVQDRGTCIETLLNIGIGTCDRNDDRNIDRLGNRRKVEVGDRAVKNNAHGPAAFHVTRKTDGTHTMRRAAADTAEYRNVRILDDGIADRRLRRKRIDRKYSIRITVADNGQIRCKDECLDAAPEDDNA